MSLLEIDSLKNGFKFSLVTSFWLSDYNMFVYRSFTFIPEGLVQCSCVIISFEKFEIIISSDFFVSVLCVYIGILDVWGFINFYSFLSFFQLDHFLLYLIFLAHSQRFCLFKEQDFRISVTCHFCWHHLLTQFWL